jgi:hypothetical protein
MRLTERDKRILEAIHAYDGMLTDDQIQALFFTGKTQMQGRTRLLFQHGYLNRPDRRQRASLPYMIYWLTERGAAFVAGLAGQDLAEFSWRREPKWATVEHDVAVNDVRIGVVNACHDNPHFTLDEWIPQSEFWRSPDRVTYSEVNGQKRTRYVRPDGYCCLTLQGKQFRLLWEIDRRSEDNPRWVREKVYPGIAYMHSETYKQRFGYYKGRILTVTTGERRALNMKRQTERAVGESARFFWFTTFDKVASNPILTAPMWWRGGEENPLPLFTV